MEEVELDLLMSPLQVQGEQPCSVPHEQLSGLRYAERGRNGEKSK
jgi:hypothetical protein